MQVLINSSTKEPMDIIDGLAIPMPTSPRLFEDSVTLESLHETWPDIFHDESIHYVLASAQLTIDKFLHEPKFFYRQGVYLQFNKDQSPISASIKGIHSYNGTDKYDLEIWSTSTDDQKETRIYNVEERFLTAM